RRDVAELHRCAHAMQAGQDVEVRRRGLQHGDRHAYRVEAAAVVREERGRVGACGIVGGGGVQVRAYFLVPQVSVPVVGADAVLGEVDGERCAAAGGVRIEEGRDGVGRG